MRNMSKMVFRRLAFIGVLFVSFALFSPVSAAEGGFLDKIKSFFSKSEPAAVETKAEEASAPVETKSVLKQNTHSPDEPTFDFSEKKIGSDDAPIKVIIFTSLTCGHCAHFHTHMLPKIIDTYVKNGRVQVILADFPLENRAMTGSLVAHCFEGDDYFKFMDLLFAKQNQWMMSPNLQESLSELAQSMGMSEAKMLACATNEMALKTLSRKRNIYIMKYRIGATPTLYFQGYGKSEKVEGAPSWKDFADKIASFEKEGGKKTQKVPAETP
ncbi:dSBA oxidoreductase [Acetobacter sp. CAG:977]|nr:dSBA oxidoreductase [Acetobacter sp. CAG:977]